MIKGTMGNAFNINIKKGDRCKLNVLQNSHGKFENGQSRTLEPHLVYNQRWTFHVAFLFVIEDLVPTTIM
jgi:hypothetical protein